MQATAPPRPAKYPTKLRRNYPRSRNGCLTCRQRKKKCDEIRPCCSACERYRISCVWPAISAEPQETAQPDPTSQAGDVDEEAHFFLTDSTRAALADFTASISAAPAAAGSAGLAGSTTPTSSTTATTPAAPASSPPTGECRGPSIADSPLWHCLPGLTVSLGSTVLVDQNSSQGTRTAEPFSKAISSDHGYRGENSMHVICNDKNDINDNDSNDNDNNDNDNDNDNNINDTSDNNDNDNTSDTNSDDNDTLAWSPQTEAFVVADVSLLQGLATGRPSVALQRRSIVQMTPLSANMLRHYIVDTGASMATSVGARNPFLAAVLPLAYTDDLVMHCVIALGGAHMSCRAFDGGGGTASTAVASAVAVPASGWAGLHDATTRHYTSVLRSVRSALEDLPASDSAQVLRLLLVLLLLAIFEGLSWNALGGGVRAHLRASRQLIAWLRRAPRPLASADERNLLGALLELYAYLAIVRDICPAGAMEERWSVVEPILSGGSEDGGEDDIKHHDDDDDADTDTDTDDATDDLVARPGLLADQFYFGLLFSGIHDLLALIPPVSRLAGACLRAKRRQPHRPRQQRLLDSVPSKAAVLRRRVMAWQLPAGWLAQAGGNEQERLWRRSIGEVYRHVLLIYLETVDAEARHPSLPPAAVQAAVQPHLAAAAEAILDTDLVASRFATVLMWPLMVLGSIVVSPDQRAILAEGMRTRPQATWSSICGADVLQQLWRRHDAAAALRPDTHRHDNQYYGPRGLARIMRECSIDLCMT